MSPLKEYTKSDQALIKSELNVFEMKDSFGVVTT